MANPMHEEFKVWDEIKKKNITMDPIVWELISHHVRNDLNLIAIASQSLRFTPGWILKTASFVISFLCRLSRHPTDSSQNLINTCNVCIKGSKRMGEFFTKLKTATCKEEVSLEDNND